MLSSFSGASCSLAAAAGAALSESHVWWVRSRETPIATTQANVVTAKAER